jgi:hypothetical protein
MIGNSNAVRGQNEEREDTTKLREAITLINQARRERVAWARV